MDHLDPLSMRGFQPPVTAELAAEVKKKSKSTEMDKDNELDESGDIFTLSEDTQSLPDKKKAAFLDEAKSEISKLDSESENFVDQATQKLVNSALKNEYGKKFTNKKEFKVMEEALTQQILRDPRYRTIIEGFLGKMQESE
ncbi:MAG: hypothetical protein LWY06_16390 [Firmicutes bacterium]|nr:hypothetical protein [Bacillota bacterium]